MTPTPKKIRRKLDMQSRFLANGFSGDVMECNSNCIRGWIREDRNPTPLLIDIFINEQLAVQNVLASRHQDEVVSAPTDKSSHAFEEYNIVWPPGLQAGSQITVEIRRHQDDLVILRRRMLQSAFTSSQTDKTKADNDIQKPISDLSDLTHSPLYRGEVTTISGSTITGWALSALNPMRPVPLDLSLAGVHLAGFTAGEPHEYVARTIGLPVKSGFSFDLNNLTEERARKALTALRATKNSAIPFELLIAVRIQGNDQSLPLSGAVQSTKVSVAAISKIFTDIIGRKTGLIAVENSFQRARYIEDLLATYPISPNACAPDVRIIAYYLPQFHPFPENDEWWGPGFTEWTNVTSARALFPGHYQPHLPADLGYYDLRIAQVHYQQIELAKKYGVSGFCYYYYWFSGRTLMTLPIDRHIDQDLDIDFCLCWANESWSRRWDGSENDVLIAQLHTYDSDVEFIHSCLRYFRSPRYIKINGAPLLQVYRIGLMERPRETIERWRDIARAEGFPDLHVCMVESFGLNDPSQYGCDSSCQFPPHGVVGDCINAEIEELDPHFTGSIYSYGEIVRGEIARLNPPHTRFRTAMPSWDNTARKGAAGNVFAGATPAMFETWLRFLVADTRRRLPQGQRLIFINAWNEWAEGTHLEPDRKFGHANLRAVRSALAAESQALAPLLPPTDGTDDRLAETRRYIASLITTNRALTWLVSQPKGGMRIPENIHFVAVSQKLMNIQVVDDGSCNIDTLNGRTVPRFSIVPLSVSQGLYIRGWAVFPNLPPSNYLMCLRPTTSTSDGMRYVAMVDHAEAREDVVATLGLVDSYLQCGFVFSATLNGVKPGEYRVDVIVPDRSNAISGRAIYTNINILVG